MRILHLLALAAPLSLTGCSFFATMQSGGFTVGERVTLMSFEAVRARASFDLECPKDKLEVVVLAASQAVPTQIGVTGCGHKGVYVSTPSGWVANTQTERAR